ncbi:hypothetical protein QYE76_018682 [Lolium multiflorum]|uniref:Myb-like domain-containing protein n=1 Tax=Lolium multiflorum TaxID=4521 RepID=A0AAD8PIT1_LOLMU|nr:hypothetical protein QYE76_018682 [Lolium multiflorum]
MARRKPPAQSGAGSAEGQTAPLKRGPWTAEEDELLSRFVEREGEGRWRTLPRRAGRVPPFGPSGKLGSQELADPAAGSTFTQKRRRSSAPAGSDPLGDATPGDEEAAARKVREEDREYYRTHKPSPLAEVEFADTRKPLTRHTDGGAEDRMEHDVEGTMVRDTADASLARAEAMFREAASRGNPAWPHSRALAAMLARRRGEGDAGAGGTAPWGS